MNKIKRQNSKSKESMDRGKGKEDDDKLYKSYRAPMRVTELKYYPLCPDLFSYPICPRCKNDIEREYQSFCEHCGQALNWKGFSQAMIITSYPPHFLLTDQ